jgi:3-oxoacyl-[acyl-carrier protein] reductase
MPENMVMLVTGTSKGIGKSLAERYAASGFQVIGCSRSPVESDLLNYQHFSVDVSDEKSVKRMFSEIRNSYGRLDILINNAGIASMNHSLLTPIETVRRVLDTNVVGTFLFCRESAKLMRRNHFGRIVNFATIATLLKLEGEAIYASSKAAVISLTQILAKEFADFGITVNAVGPTPIQTDLIRSVPKEKIDNLINQQAIKRLGEIEDIANVIDFFIQQESEFVTGQVVFLGGV